MKPSPAYENRYPTEIILECENGHRRRMSPTRFEDWIEESYDEYQCRRCGEELDLETPSTLQLECYICDAQFDFNGFEEAHLILQERCPNCCGRYDFPKYSVHVPGSWAFYHGIYDWTARGKSSAALERGERTDYWEGVVHFCDAKEFVSIYEAGRIRASATGFFKHTDPKHSKAVCLTEATQPNWKELQEVHGGYGFVFRKRDVINLGGAPAIYLPDPLLGEMKLARGRFVNSLKPFVTMLRPRKNKFKKSKHDFLHER